MLRAVLSSTSFYFSSNVTEHDFSIPTHVNVIRRTKVYREIFVNMNRQTGIKSKMKHGLFEDLLK